MSAATISTNKKLADGTLLSIGGVTAEDFEANLVGLLGRGGADAVLAEVRSTFTPVSAGAGTAGDPWGQQYQPPPAVVQAFPQAQPVQQQPAAAASVQLCPSHQAPAQWRQKKDNSGGFWKCTVNDSIISEFSDSTKVKSFCPAPKQR